MSSTLARRSFLAGGLAAAALGRWPRAAGHPLPTGAPYEGPRVVLVRYGGGVRRRETIDPAHTHSPYLLNELIPRGTLFSRMEIDAGAVTSHGQGTLHLLTGKYDCYVNRATSFLGEEFEPTVPTLFEYLRKSYEVPPHQTLIVNNENRPQEEYFTSSNHHRYGIDYRSEVLSLHRLEVFRLREKLEQTDLDDDVRVELSAQLDEKLADDPRIGDLPRAPELEGFWRSWGERFGADDRAAPRGDRRLTELAVRALQQLRPRLMMINYSDPDYVHWGNPQHYTRGIQVIDDGLRRLVETVEADEELRANTVFAIVPDCGRDHNRLVSLPYQHHFGSRESRRIFALFFGPGLEAGVEVDRRCEQVEVAPTIGRLMGVKTELAEGAVLEEALA